MERRPPRWGGEHDRLGRSEASSGKLSSVPIPLPPIAEQKRIVAKLEEVLACVDAARERLAEKPTILKRFRQSVLAAACSGRLTADWREENRNEVVGDQLVDQVQDAFMRGGGE